jgi:NAD(P) transhydrogenase subunit alpha
MVASMRAGAVIVDLAAETGGNCALSKPGETIQVNDVTIIAPLNVPSTVAFHASQMFGRNIFELLKHLVKEGVLQLDPTDEITGAMLMTRRTGAQIMNLLELYVFVLAAFVGFMVISRVPPLLHTPLMAATNAISGISLVGSLIAAGAARDRVATLLGFIAVIAATSNIVGGFLITDRMLRMFKSGNAADKKAGPR